MTTAEILRRARNLPALDAEQAIAQAIVDIDADEMDAPADWDAGSVTFDPYIG